MVPLRKDYRGLCHWRKAYLALCVAGYEEYTFGDDNKTWDKYVRNLGYQRYTMPDAKSYTTLPPSETAVVGRIKAVNA